MKWPENVLFIWRIVRMTTISSLDKIGVTITRLQEKKEPQRLLLAGDSGYDNQLAGEKEPQRFFFDKIRITVTPKGRIYNHRGYGRCEVVVREPVGMEIWNPQGSELIKSVELKPPQGRN